MARYRFGVFEADEASGGLTRAGRRIPIAPQPFRALAILLQNAGEVVTRDELRRALWNEGTFVEFDQGLNFVIARLRGALGDHAHAARFVETLPRRGYRFVAPSERIELAAEPAAPQRSPRSTPGRRLAQAARAALLALLALAGGPEPFGGAHAPSSAAREALERGRSLADAGQWRRSLAEFRRAATLDPAFAEAHFAVASNYIRLGETGELAAADAFPIARVEAERALALEDVADSHMLLGGAYFVYEWDFEKARREYERAVALAPRSTAPLSAYARLLSAAGEHNAAIAAIGKAEALSPSCDLVLHEAAWAHYRARRFADAIRKFERAAALGPPHFTDRVSWEKLNRFRILLVHVQMGATDAAAEDADAIVRLSGTPAERLAGYRASSAPERVDGVLRRSLALLARQNEHEYVSPVRFAEIHAALHNDDEALRWLTRAALERAPALAGSVGDPVFDRLNALPLFRQLLMGLREPGQERAAGGLTLLADARLGRVQPQ